LKDEKVEVNFGYKKPLILRKIAFWDATQNRLFVFITNNYNVQPDEIAAYNKKQIAN
jgi:hypothetical protein